MIKPEDTCRKSTLNSESDITCRADLIVLVIYLAGYETDGAGCYHPDRILILVLEEPDEDIIKPPITGLLIGNVIDVVSLNPCVCG